jgi:hypothetical protein
MSKEILPQRSVWLIGIGVAVLALLLGSAFYGAWDTNRGLRAEIATLRPMITAAIVEQQTLEAQLAYVQSEEYVESWSQAHARMVRQGETLVILIEATPTPTPIPVLVSEEPTPTPDPEPFWVRWWQMLLGD